MVTVGIVTFTSNGRIHLFLGTLFEDCLSMLPLDWFVPRVSSQSVPLDWFVLTLRLLRNVDG